MTNDLFLLQATLEQALRNHQSVGILTHKNPDGDGFAAALALKAILAARGQQCDIVMEKPAPDTYWYLQGQQNSRVFSPQLSYELLIILDCHERKRVGICAPLIDTATQIIAIDHHRPGALLQQAFTFIDTTYVSVGGIIWDLFKNERLQGEPLTYVVNALYTTVLNDTDGFLNSNTDTRTFTMCAELTALGLDVREVSANFMLGKTPAELHLVGQVLSTITSRAQGKILFLYSTRQMLTDNNLDDEATTKMTRWVKGAKGVEVTIYFRETGDDMWNLSLRSVSADINQIAVKYGGGGHKLASGCNVTGKLSDVQNQLEQDILAVL